MSTLGLSGNADVPAVYVNRGTVDFKKKDIDWGPPICTHITQPAADSPDKNWITCDNWPNSKGYGTCYEEYDNNGNGNRLLMQWTDDSGLTWHPAPNLNTNPAIPGNGNTGDVQNETTLAAPASPGDTNVKVTSVTNLGTTLAAAAVAGATNIKVTSTAPFFTTTLAAAANAGDTNIKVASVTGLLPGQTLNVDTGASLESRVISVGRNSGRERDGRHAHGTRSAPRMRAGRRSRSPARRSTSTPARGSRRARSSSSARPARQAPASRSRPPSPRAHASGAQVNDAVIKVDVDPSGGNQETVNVLSVGTAGAAGTGVTSRPALTKSHVQGAPTANAAAPAVGAPAASAASRSSSRRLRARLPERCAAASSCRSRSTA